MQQQQQQLPPQPGPQLHQGVLHATGLPSQQQQQQPPPEQPQHPQQQQQQQQVEEVQPQQQAQQQQELAQFWAEQTQSILAIDPDQVDFKTHELPLARIKKIMKSEEEGDPGGPRFMISAEAPVVFAKACEIFILELTMKAWDLTEDNKRRTLQRNDISLAVTRSDQYDFLIDIVPRDEIKTTKKQDDARGMTMTIDPQQYFLLQQQQLAAAAQAAGPAQAMQMQQLYWQQLAAQQAYLAQQQEQQQQQADPQLLQQQQQQQLPPSEIQPPPPENHLQQQHHHQQHHQPVGDGGDEETATHNPSM